MHAPRSCSDTAHAPPLADAVTYNSTIGARPLAITSDAAFVAFGCEAKSARQGLSPSFEEGTVHESSAPKFVSLPPLPTDLQEKQQGLGFALIRARCGAPSDAVKIQGIGEAGHRHDSMIEGNGELVYRSAELVLLPPAVGVDTAGPLEPSLKTIFLNGIEHVVDVSDFAVREAIEFLLRAQLLPS